jgi:hypothetical protein
MAGVTGLEPATSGVTGRRSNQLSYTPGFITLGNDLKLINRRFFVKQFSALF